MPLTNKQIEAAKGREKPYKLFDGHGLYIEVQPNGRRYWRLKYRFRGREKRIGLGVFPDVKLADARIDAVKQRELLRAGKDPTAERRADKLARKAEQDVEVEKLANSFEAIADQWYSKKKAQWTPKTAKRTKVWLTKDLAPLARRPISEITSQELIAALELIESRGALTTADRVRRTAVKVFRYARQVGLVEHNIALDLDEVLEAVKPVEHRAAIIDPAQLGAFLSAVGGYHGTTIVRVALDVLPRLFVRPGNLRHMEWPELDFDKSIWSIPAKKMKMREPLIVPLATQVKAALQSLQPFSGHRTFVFPGQRSGDRPISENTLNAAYRYMGFGKDVVTAHGFRATARTLLVEELECREDLVEQQLAHTVRDPAGRAYNRTKFLKERQAMMQQWSDYLDELKAKHESAK